MIKNKDHRLIESFLKKLYEENNVYFVDILKLGKKENNKIIDLMGAKILTENIDQLLTKDRIKFLPQILSNLQLNNNITKKLLSKLSSKKSKIFDAILGLDNKEKLFCLQACLDDTNILGGIFKKNMDKCSFFRSSNYIDRIRNEISKLTSDKQEVKPIAKPN